MHFDRHGRTYQLRIQDAEDLDAVLELDDSLWVATSAPISALSCDPTFLDLVDVDDNGRIRADEIRLAIRWLLKRLRDRSHLAERTDTVQLAWLEDSSGGGRKLCATAAYVLEKLGVESRESIGIAQLSAFRESLRKNPVNGDGVIPPEASSGEEAWKFIEDVARCVGSQEDMAGGTGVTADGLDEFIEQAEALLEWHAEGALAEGQSASDVMPLGERTPGAWGAVAAVREKVDGYFARCRLMQFDPRSARLVGVHAHESDPEALQSGQAIDDALRRAALAEPNSDGILHLDGPVNPLFAEALSDLRELALEPALGREVRDLGQADWKSVVDLLAPHGDWLVHKPAGGVESLGVEKLERYLQGTCIPTVRGLLEADREVADRMDDAEELTRLLLYHRLLLPLANNFVSFPDLYDPERRALFEMGSLVIDGRWFNFAVKVEDQAEHSKLAKTSGMYVMYVDVVRAGEEGSFVAAVPATAGTVGNLCAGKRGVFYDTRGRHYDARVVKIIENPISFREAMFAPFVRLGRFIGGKIEAISGSAEKELESQLGKATDKVETGVQEAVRHAPDVAASAPQPAAGQPVQTQGSAASRRDLLVGASVSLAALSSAFAFITKQLAGLSTTTLVVAVLVVLVVVFLPTAIVAGYRLRRRDLSALLEGCGWAINARMRLNAIQRAQFTHHEPYPEGSTGTPKRGRMIWALIGAILLAIAVWVCQAVRLWG
jgi:hypothetical protein